MAMMLFHGPNKTPFFLAEDGVAVRDGPVPIHGIISTGLRDNFRASGLSASSWHQYGHLVGEAADCEAVVALQQRARDCGVLSFGQSATCARLYVEAYYERVTAGVDTVCALWNTKEGHTSSVWVITISDQGLSYEDRFVLNVARDRQAGVALKRTADRMQAITRHHNDINMARVFDYGSVRVRSYGASVDVLVTRNQWIAGDEIHSFTGDGGAPPYYVAVESFLLASDEPTRIGALRGRRLTPGDQAKLECDLASFRRLASVDGAVQVNVHEGDVVWDGHMATVVAIS
jgi:hypothetical protein